MTYLIRLTQEGFLVQKKSDLKWVLLAGRPALGELFAKTCFAGHVNGACFLSHSTEEPIVSFRVNFFPKSWRTDTWRIKMRGGLSLWAEVWTRWPLQVPSELPKSKEAMLKLLNIGILEKSCGTSFKDSLITESTGGFKEEFWERVNSKIHFVTDICQSLQGTVPALSRQGTALLGLLESLFWWAWGSWGHCQPKDSHYS